MAAALWFAAPRERFAMNAGMFDDDSAPIGLCVERGAQQRRINRARGDGNFHLRFSAEADGALHVETTDAYVARAPHPQWATQSGPMLLIDGALHPAIQPNQLLGPMLVVLERPRP